MKKIILMTLTALTLTGGAAMADGFHNNNREPARVETTHYRNAHERPVVRFERHNDRHGFRWVGGEWRWGHGEWNWVPGHYARR